ncbi:cation transport ATPase [Fructobacillus fructosus]|uniref:AAA family ATPase n=1 Tax=Fructobacillus fructosus TaxID=1631 RepID=UPI0006754C86|nr:AAA family ATPase [Fructobacillus fructosus]KRN51782.1 hypothetical protein IV71_GL000462 [Fructobacillus fructosus KCTC 3544]GAP01750.1 cation transport ATPase [Fructobacillus fructosus]
MLEININVPSAKVPRSISTFQEEIVSLKNKNFIFARNGAGKSTFSEIIKQQCCSEYDVQIFSGFEQLLGENDHLNAFALEVNASSNQKLIAEKEDYKDSQKKLLDVIQREIGSKEDDDSSTLRGKLFLANDSVSELEDKIRGILSNAASIIKNTSNPQISGTSYNITNLKKEKNKAKSIPGSEISKLEKTINSQKKSVDPIIWNPVKFELYLKSVNEIITSKVKQKKTIPRLKNSDKAIRFAQKGMEIHKHIDGTICSFCGNPISEQTFNELETFFSSDEISELQNRINRGITDIEFLLQKVESLNISSEEFYPQYVDEVQNLEKDFTKQKENILFFLKNLLNQLHDKNMNLFSEQQKINLAVPTDFNLELYNTIVSKNIDYGNRLAKEKEKAKDLLRFDKIKQLLDDAEYHKFHAQLESAQKLKKEAQSDFKQKDHERLELEKKISNIEKEIELLKPKAEEQAVLNINKKLRNFVPWSIAYLDDESSGYYQIKQCDERGITTYRGVKELSTGEKNIIAFLYFMQKLLVPSPDNKQRIIIFDDPMTSNDATMQYLIITELQNLYGAQSEYRHVIRSSRDYIVILTHNVFFYLNVSPHGAYKDKNGLTKYDKCNFYSIESGKFRLVKSEKEDLRTSYDSLWIELSELKKNNLTNSMLNSMRRIIETYLEFTSIDRNKFYRGKELYSKLFNVNSHSVIQDISTQSTTYSAEELIDVFKQLFIENNAEDHFNKHWHEV